MNEQDIDHKYDELLMIIYTGKPGIGRNIFVHTVRTAVNDKLEQVIEILARNNVTALADEIRRLGYN